MKAIFTGLFFSICLAATSQSFTVVPLGVKGGLDESDLSAYMVAPRGSNDYICLDAGTLYSGIQKAIETGAFSSPATSVLRNSIKAYFISHPHLDHVAGLIINSPDDSAKSIYGLQPCLNVIRDKYFSWQSWANFGDEGEKPQLNKYHYAPLTPGRETAIQRTALSVQAWPLSHGAPYESTAFLVRSGDSYLLYLGDTGADSLEHSDRLHTLWLVAGPLLRAGRLKAIFIETSFPNEQPDKLLFGHLTPRLLMQEMQALANIAEMPSLDSLNLVITHRKPSGNNEEIIRRQLEENNRLKAKLIFPEQGKRLDF
jgi:cAMP phosphodiesterase